MGRMGDDEPDLRAELRPMVQMMHHIGAIEAGAQAGISVVGGDRAQQAHRQNGRSNG